MTKNDINTIYIISKGRPQCKTARTLKKINYPGKWYIVCGTNDDTVDEYMKNWGEEKIILFDWENEVKESDLLDNFGVENMPSGAVPVRNATRKISEKLGELRHWQLDDDYTHFRIFDRVKNGFVKCTGQSLEESLYKVAKFAFKCSLPNSGVSLSHETHPKNSLKYARRVFNAHNMPSNEDLFQNWRGRMNDDLVNAIEVYNSGSVEFSFKYVSITPMPTQSEQGGLTDIYESEGTVRKTAYAILMAPHATRLIIKFGRYHHKVNWRYITPKIIHEKYQKSST